MTPQRTFWHLESLRRKPNEYDIVTSSLLYYPPRGFEVKVPLTAWYEQHQKGSGLRSSDWDRFRDPRETTYTKYTELQKAKEIYVDGLLASIDSTGYDRRLSPEWLGLLARVLGPLRYPVHGLQMTAAYVGSMAPGGRIVIAAMLQAADEMRRIQRLAYRMRQIQETHPGFAEASRTLWQQDTAWQPIRELVERLLVTYDWGEAFVALNLVVKPAFDELFMTHFGSLATAHGDEALAKILRSLHDDCSWHREWSRALVEVVLAEDAEQRGVIAGWMDRWVPRALGALEAFGPVLGLGRQQWPSLGLDALG